MKLARSSSSAVVSLLFLASAALGGCGGNNDSTTGSGGSTTSDSTTGGSGGAGASSAGGAGGTDAGGAGGAGGEPLPDPQKRKTMSGDVTWQVTFDATAKAAGATDCSYTRHYEGVEDRSAKWLCPSCEVMFLADVQVTSGLADCYSQVTSSMPAAKEWIGWGNGVYWRGLGGPMTEQGTAGVNGATVETTNLVEMLEAPVGGTLSFAVSGALTLGEDTGDLMNGFVPPDTYACGWPKAKMPEYTGDWQLKKGAIVPDGLFKDSYGETVRLHDFAGDYLIVDMSAMDCPPCQSFASEEEQFVKDMEAQGVKVHVITLLAPSLNNVFGNTSQAMLKNWINNFNLTAPVLADRGWGVASFGPAIGDQLGYPSFAVVAPDLTVLDFTTGFDGFATVKQIILADMN